MTVLWANVVSAWRCRWCELFESSHWFVPGLFFECLWCRWCESHSVAGCVSDYCRRNCVSCVGRPAIEFKAVMFVMSMGLKAHVISCEACELCHSCFLCELWQSISSSVCQAHLSCCSAVLRVIKFLSVMTVVAALETLGTTNMMQVVFVIFIAPFQWWTWNLSLLSCCEHLNPACHQTYTFHSAVVSYVVLVRHDRHRRDVRHFRYTSHIRHGCHESDSRKSMWRMVIPYCWPWHAWPEFSFFELVYSFRCCRCCDGDFNLIHFPEEIEHRYWVFQHCFLSKTHMGIYCCQKQCYYCSQMGFSRLWPEAVWVMSVMRHHARVTHRNACRHSRENLNTTVWRDVVVHQTSRIHGRRRLETSFQDVN